MKKMISFLLALTMMITFTSCAGQGQEETLTPDIVPSSSRMQSICELAVVECYYHNVAKSYEPDAEGILWWKKDRLFWIEYNAVARYGIEVSKLSMYIKDDVVTVSIPQAKLLELTIDDPKDFEYIVAEDSAKITAEDEQIAIAQAQATLEEEVSNNAMLLTQAQQRAEDLLKEYIESINELGEKSFKVEFNVISDDSDYAPEITTDLSEQTENTEP